jgi:hypothetical protein
VNLPHRCRQALLASEFPDLVRVSVDPGLFQQLRPLIRRSADL